MLLGIENKYTNDNYEKNIDTLTAPIYWHNISTIKPLSKQPNIYQTSLHRCRFAPASILARTAEPSGRVLLCLDLSEPAQRNSRAREWIQISKVFIRVDVLIPWFMFGRFFRVRKDSTPGTWRRWNTKYVRTFFLLC